jgi:hypothetical protein
MMTKAPNEVPLEALCEANTRSVSPFEGLVALGLEPPPPQASKPKLKRTKAENKNANFFKREAPNHWKTGDLGAK